METYDVFPSYIVYQSKHRALYNLINITNMKRKWNLINEI